MLNSIQVFPQQCPWSNLYREAEDSGTVRLIEVCFSREPLRLQEVSQRIFVIRTNTADVKSTMLRMDTTSSTCELRDCTLRLNGGDSHRTIDPNSISVLSVSINSNTTKVLQQSRQCCVIRIIEQSIVKDTCHRHTKQPLLFSVRLPDLPKIREAGHRRLKSSKDSCHSNLVPKRLHIIIATNNDRRKITELIRTQDNF